MHSGGIPTSGVKNKLRGEREDRCDTALWCRKINSKKTCKNKLYSTHKTRLDSACKTKSVMLSSLTLFGKAGEQVGSSLLAPDGKETLHKLLGCPLASV